jgi:hypothetical protein
MSKQIYPNFSIHWQRYDSKTRTVPRAVAALSAWPDNWVRPAQMSYKNGKKGGEVIGGRKNRGEELFLYKGKEGMKW